jgi:nucleoside-diphosphate-sugar epimerase
MTTVLVTGASGFVGSKLAQALVDAGHDVRAMTRHPDTYQGAGEAVYGDVGEPDSRAAAHKGTTAAN